MKASMRAYHAEACGLSSPVQKCIADLHAYDCKLQLQEIGKPSRNAFKSKEMPFDAMAKLEKGRKRFVRFWIALLVCLLMRCCSCKR